MPPRENNPRRIVRAVHREQRVLALNQTFSPEPLSGETFLSRTRYVTPMQEMFRWTLLTAFAVSLITFLLDFVTRSLGIRLIVAIVLIIVSIWYAMKKYGVPDSAFQSGSVIALAGMAGLLVAQTLTRGDFLEYVITLALFVIAYFVGGCAAKFALSNPEERRKKEESFDG
jgi:hypothetical protein